MIDYSDIPTSGFTPLRRGEGGTMPLNARAVICAPIISAGVVTGAIVAYSCDVGTRFSDVDKKVKFA